MTRLRSVVRTGLLTLAAAGLLGSAAAPPACPPGTRRHETAREGFCTDAAGARQGPIWGRFPDGSLRYLGEARNDLTHGSWRSWHANGTPSIEAIYANGQLSGPFRMWSAEGRLVYSGQHDEHGRMDGRFERWWPDGTPRLRWEMRAGVHHGVVEAWYESGGPRLRGARREGLDDGEWSWWNEDGGLARRCRFAAGRAVAGPCDAIPASVDERPAAAQ